SKLIIGVTGGEHCLVAETLRNGSTDCPGVGELIEVHLKAVRLKQFLVIGEIVVALIIRLMLIPFDQKSPPAIAVAKINRAVHRLHTAFLQPLPALVKK